MTLVASFFCKHINWSYTKEGPWEDFFRKMYNLKGIFFMYHNNDYFDYAVLMKKICYSTIKKNVTIQENFVCWA